MCLSCGFLFCASLGAFSLIMPSLDSSPQPMLPILLLLLHTSGFLFFFIYYPVILTPPPPVVYQLCRENGHMYKLKMNPVFILVHGAAWIILSWVTARTEMNGPLHACPGSKNRPGRCCVTDPRRSVPLPASAPSRLHNRRTLE